MRLDLLTLFPDMVWAVLRTSILGRAAEAGLVSYHVHDIRTWSDNPHGKVDDRPFGGGPGMVMTCQPLHAAVTAVEGDDPRPATRILLTPQGRRLSQSLVEELSQRPRLLLIAGHYEGIDERVIEELAPIEISVGDYVVSGGEIPSLLLVDAVVRLIPGVLGHAESAGQDSFSPGQPHSGQPCVPADAGAARLLEGPQYTRPRVWMGRAAPEVLLSGDHAAVAAWRATMMLARTRERRPDLLA